ncbi:hypothetical protein MXB_1224 [Myxobolus squamalis]|nr:hypothetical protein MXB_1224 [Myxobolus squamalis]
MMKRNQSNLLGTKLQTFFKKIVFSIFNWQKMKLLCSLY